MSVQSLLLTKVKQQLTDFTPYHALNSDAWKQILKASYTLKYFEFFSDECLDV